MIFRAAAHLALVLGVVTASHRICPIPECDECLDVDLETAPGVGLHLGLTYGALSISNGDNQTEHVARIPGTEAYDKLMRELTAHPKRLEPPPMDTIAERLEYARQRLQRKLNLLRGRPGTANAGTLARMLSALHEEAKLHLDVPVTTVGIAVSNAVPVSREEIDDALTFARLQPIAKRLSIDRELNAAYGALGFGLCSSFRDTYKCKEEEAAMGDGDVVLHFDYTSNSLVINSAWPSTARSTLSQTLLVDWTLGLDEATRFPSPDEYWTAVRQAVERAVGSTRRPFTQVLLSGDQANDKRFIRAIQDALSPLQLSAAQLLHPDNYQDLAFIISEGVAIFQWRRQRGWLECVQPKKCKHSSVTGHLNHGSQKVL